MNLAKTTTQMNDDTQIVVYQMGKVGSQTIWKSLQKMNLPNPVYHIHALNPENVERSIEILNSKGASPSVQLKQAQELIGYLEQRQTLEMKIITIVREPIVHLLSSFFQRMQVYYPQFIGSDGSWKIHEIAEEIYSLVCSKKISAFNWFDQEFKRGLEIDVYNYSFDRSRGYGKIAKYPLEILLLRLESSDTWKERITEFLNLSVPLEITTQNQAEAKDYKNAYDQVESMLKFPPEVLSEIYSSQYCQHFYSPEMIEEFVQKWSVEERPINPIPETSDSPPKAIESEAEEKYYLQIWKTFNQTDTGRIDPENLQYSTQIQRGKVEKYLGNTVNYKVLKLGEATPEDKAFLEQNKLSYSLLKLLHNQDDWQQQKRYLFDLNLESKVDIESIEQLEVNQETAFQEALVELGILCTICPFTGKTIYSNQSFFWGHFIGIYRCVGEEVFYLIAAQESFRKVFAYFPHLELIVNLSSSPIDPVGLINKWKSYLIANWEKVIAYLNFQEKRPKVNLLGFRESVAHSCYNELAGVDLLRQTGRLNKIDKFLVGCNTYFGSLNELFPEIIPEKIIAIGAKEKALVHEQLLEQQYLGFKYCNRRGRVSEELARRIYKVAEQKCSPSTRANIKAAKKCFPLIWIDIRVHKRAWISQVEGLTNLLIELSKDYPNLGVVFQGMALPENVDRQDDLSWPQKQKMIEQDREVVQKILDGIDSYKIVGYDEIGCMMYDSIVWANTVDFYIAPWGAGLTRLTLIANKPGIIHTNHYTLESNIIKNWFNEYQRENGVSPIFVSGEFITVLEGSGGDQLHDDSYECDWRGVYEKAVEVIRNLKNKE